MAGCLVSSAPVRDTYTSTGTWLNIERIRPFFGWACVAEDMARALTCVKRGARPARRGRAEVRTAARNMVVWEWLGRQ